MFGVSLEERGVGRVFLSGKMRGLDDGCCGFESEKLAKTVYWVNLLVSLLLVVAGIVSIVSFFSTITALLSNPLSFAVFLYAM